MVNRDKGHIPIPHVIFPRPALIHVYLTICRKAPVGSSRDQTAKVRGVDARPVLVYGKRGSIPAHAFGMPSGTREHLVLFGPDGEVMRTCPRVGVVLAIDGNRLVNGRVVADALKAPLVFDKIVALDDGERVVVIARIGVIQAKHRQVGEERHHPANAFVDPTDAADAVALRAVRGVEMLARLRVVDAVQRHGLLRLSERLLGLGARLRFRFWSRLLVDDDVDWLGIRWPRIILREDDIGDRRRACVS